MIKSAFKEGSLLFAFIVLGAMLLLCLWIAHNLNRSVLEEFKHGQISLILKEGAEASVRNIIEKDKKVVRYEFHSAEKNKERLMDLYPELKNVLQPLEPRFFPSSALVTTEDPSSLMTTLESQNGILEKSLIHQPPLRLQKFVNMAAIVFVALWLLTLSLVLYFNLERITALEEPRWSLMKMLGARSGKLFWPFWAGQAGRIAIATIVAMGLAAIASSQIRSFFVWDWRGLPLSVWCGFLVVSISITTIISFGLFRSRYRQVSIG